MCARPGALEYAERGRLGTRAPIPTIGVGRGGSEKCLRTRPLNLFDILEPLLENVERG